MTVLSPEPGRIALVRQRRYLVENVTPPPSPNEAMLVDLSCLDDDGWSAVADKGFDEPALFAAYLRTMPRPRARRGGGAPATGRSRGGGFSM